MENSSPAPELSPEILPEPTPLPTPPRLTPARVYFRRHNRALILAITLFWIIVVIAIAWLTTSETHTVGEFQTINSSAGNTWNSHANNSHAGVEQVLPSRTFRSLEVTDGGFSLLGWLDGPMCSRNFPGWFAGLLWVVGVLYTFLAVAIVCDDYFVASLEAISKALNLSEDVAGATFMAAGSSAPELFSSVVGVFFVANVKEDNVGPGTIVGSAVFNIAVIIGASVLCAGNVLRLDWWPVARDGTFYVISIIILTAVFTVVTPGQVDWFEGLFMMVAYGGYIALMKYNSKIVDWLNTKYPTGRQVILEDEGDQMSLCSEDQQECTTIDCRSDDGEVKSEKLSGDVVLNMETEIAESEAETDSEAKGLVATALWVVSLPVLLLFKFTIPNCNSERWKKYYMVTFIMSVLWIGAISYLMVEFGIKLSKCLHLSTNVMALTVLAAGTSVPDALSSILVAKMGKGNMAVSNAIGSNVFDILLGLGLPWFLSGAFVRRQPLPINTDGILIYVLMLLIVLVIFLALAKLSRWCLSLRHGCILLILYPLYVAVSIMIDKGIITAN